MLADTGLFAVGDFSLDTRGLMALRANDHNLAGRKRQFLLDDAALLLCVTGFDVLRCDVNAFDNDLAVRRDGMQEPYRCGRDPCR